MLLRAGFWIAYGRVKPGDDDRDGLCHLHETFEDGRGASGPAQAEPEAAGGPLASLQIGGGEDAGDRLARDVLRDMREFRPVGF